MKKYKYDADYKKMYLTLFNAMLSAIKAIEEQNYGQTIEILKKGQQEAEEIYMGTEE